MVRLFIFAVFTLVFGERSGSDLTGEHRISSLSHCGRCHCVVSLSKSTGSTKEDKSNMTEKC